ncbi:hypothetical protein P9112_012987 [Eukaryota sp. TZLM1-RC]
MYHFRKLGSGKANTVLSVDLQGYEYKVFRIRTTRDCFSVSERNSFQHYICSVLSIPCILYSPVHISSVPIGMSEYVDRLVEVWIGQNATIQYNLSSNKTFTVVCCELKPKWLSPSPDETKSCRFCCLHYQETRFCPLKLLFEDTLRETCSDLLSNKRNNIAFWENGARVSDLQFEQTTGQSCLDIVVDIFRKHQSLLWRLSFLQSRYDRIGTSGCVSRLGNGKLEVEHLHSLFENYCDGTWLSNFDNANTVDMNIKGLCFANTLRDLSIYFNFIVQKNTRINIKETTIKVKISDLDPKCSCRLKSRWYNQYKQISTLPMIDHCLGVKEFKSRGHWSLIQ